MDDLKERLRARHQYEAKHDAPADPLWNEAADRIAELEEKLAEITARLAARDAEIGRG